MKISKFVAGCLFGFNIVFASTLNMYGMLNSNTAINNFDNQLNNNVVSFENKIQQKTKGKKPTKKDYLAIIRALEERDTFNDNIILGTIYAYGIWGDNKKVLISANPKKAYYYLLRSYKQGYDKALLYLVGILINNKLMHEEIDPDYKLAYKYVNLYLKKHPNDPNGLFWKVMVDSKIGKFNEMTNILMKLATKYNNSDAQLMLALIFLNGLYSPNGVIINPNIDTANYFLNMACLNKNKSQKVKSFCSNSNIVERVEHQKNNKQNQNETETKKIEKDFSEAPKCLQ